MSLHRCTYVYTIWGLRVKLMNTIPSTTYNSIHHGLAKNKQNFVILSFNLDHQKSSVIISIFREWINPLSSVNNQTNI